MSIDLLEPRYKVIADYPNQYYRKGHIVRKLFIDDEYKTEEWFAQYPAIFQPLQWWEERKPEEMPEYVKHSVEGTIRKFKDFSAIEGNGVVKLFDVPGEIEYQESVPMSVREQGYELYDIREWLPATSEEYTQYITNKNA